MPPVLDRIDPTDSGAYRVETLRIGNQQRRFALLPADAFSSSSQVVPPPPTPPAGIAVSPGENVAAKLALAIADASKTLLFHAGTHQVGSTIWGSLTGRTETGIIIRSYGDGPVILEGAGAAHFLYIAGDNWELSGTATSPITIRGYLPDTDNAVLGLADADGFQMEYVTILGPGGLDTTKHLVEVFGSATGVTFDHVTLTGAQGSALLTFPSTAIVGITVTDSTLGSDYVSALLWGGGTVDLIRVTFVGTPVRDVDVNTGTVTIDSCLTLTGKGAHESGGTLINDGSIPDDTGGPTPQDPPDGIVCEPTDNFAAKLEEAKLDASLTLLLRSGTHVVGSSAMGEDAAEPPPSVPGNTYPFDTSASDDWPDFVQLHPTGGDAHPEFWDVGGGRGTLAYAASELGQAFFMSPSAGLDQRADADIRMTVSTNKLAVGQPQETMTVLRWADVDNHYQAIVRFNTNGTISHGLNRVIAGTWSLRVAYSTVSGLTHTANAQFNIRVQITGAAATPRVKVRVWAVGSAEPGTWTLDYTDSGAGALTGVQNAIGGYLETGTTNAPVVYAFEELRIGDIGYADQTAVVIDGATYDFQSQTETDSWGADFTQGYPPSPTTPFDIAAGVATIELTSGDLANTYAMTADAPLQATADLRYRIATNKLAVGQPQEVVIPVRWTDVDNWYNAYVKFTTGQAVQLGLNRHQSAVFVAKVAATTVSGLTHAADRQFDVRIQVTGATGTPTIKSRVWQVGTAEPATWTVNFTDSGSTLSGTRHGVGMYLETGTSNTPVKMSLDEMRIGDIGYNDLAAVGDTGHVEDDIIITSYGNGPVIIDGAGALGLFNLSGDDWTLAGKAGSEITIRNYSPVNRGVIRLLGSASGFTMDLVTMTGGQGGISGHHLAFETTGTGHEITNCSLLDAAGSAISVVSGASTLLVQDCTISADNIGVKVLSGTTTLDTVSFVNSPSGVPQWDVQMTTPAAVTVDDCQTTTGRGVNVISGTLTTDDSIPDDSAAPPPPPPPPPGGGIELSPGQTFSTRLAAAIADGTKTLLIHAGTYAVGSSIWGGGGGRSENSIRIRSYGDGPVTLTGGGANNFLYLTGDDWIIAGRPGSEITVSGYQPSDNGVMGLVGSVSGFLMEYVTVIMPNYSTGTPNNNHIFYNASTGGTHTIRNCKFLNAMARALQVYSGNATMVVESTILSSKNITALVWDGNVTFRSCTFQNSAYGNAVYDIEAGDRVTVRTCTTLTGRGIWHSGGTLDNDGSLPVS